MIMMMIMMLGEEKEEEKEGKEKEGKRRKSERGRIMLCVYSFLRVTKNEVWKSSLNNLRHEFLNSF